MAHNGFGKRCRYCWGEIVPKNGYVQIGEFVYHHICWRKLEAERKLEETLQQWWNHRRDDK